MINYTFGDNYKTDRGLDLTSVSNSELLDGVLLYNEYVVMEEQEGNGLTGDLRSVTLDELKIFVNRIENELLRRLNLVGDTDFKGTGFMSNQDLNRLFSKSLRIIEDYLNGKTVSNEALVRACSESGYLWDFGCKKFNNDFTDRVAKLVKDHELDCSEEEDVYYHLDSINRHLEYIFTKKLDEECK